MKFLIIYYIIFGTFYVTSCDEDILVETKNGFVLGLEEETIVDSKKYHSFKGIPYAQPPLGKLRFLPPKPRKKWKNIWHAIVHKEFCFFYNVFMRRSMGKEDCLYLNVYTPNLNSEIKANLENENITDTYNDTSTKNSTLLPVIVFFNSLMTKTIFFADRYGPDFFITKDVLVVTFEYRHDILGYLNLGIKEVPGNAALKDQVAVLKWVNQNIEAFGGDPNSVTLLGLDEGANFVLLHTVSPMSAGLFHKVVAMSGRYSSFEECFTEINSEITKQSGLLVGKKLGYNTDNASLLLEFLQDLPLEKVWDAHNPGTEIIVEENFGQDIFLDRNPRESLKYGNVHIVDIMFSYSSQETVFLFFMHRLYAQRRDLPPNYDIRQDIADNYNNDKPGRLFRPTTLKCATSNNMYWHLHGKVKRHYTGNGANVYNVGQVIRYYNYASFIVSTVRLARMWSRIANTYLLKFSSYSSRNLADKFARKYGVGGPGYIDIVNYIFHLKSLGLPISQDGYEHRLVEKLTTAITYFVKYGEPSPDCVMGVEWLKFEKDVQAYAEFTYDFHVYSASDDEDINFWDEIYAAANINDDIEEINEVANNSSSVDFL